MSLLAGLVYLGSINRQKSQLIRSQTKTIQEQEKKISQYDIASDSLLQMLIDYSVENNLSYDARGDLFENFSKVFTVQSSLKNSLSYQAKKNQTIVSDLINLKSQLKGKNTLLKGLDTKNDTINFLLKRTDSLAFEIDKMSAAIRDATTDTLSIVSPLGVKIFYFGDIVDDKPMGLGMGFYDKKGHYVGNWYKNMRNGSGKHFYANGDVYHGLFVNDKREGFGVYYYATGDKYAGWWELDLMSGQGTITTKDGKSKRGVWKKGKLVEKIQ